MWACLAVRPTAVCMMFFYNDTCYRILRRLSSNIQFSDQNANEQYKFRIGIGLWVVYDEACCV